MTHIFIFNPYSNGASSKMLRMKLSEYKELRYFIFNIMENLNFEEAVQQILHIFEGEKLRIYCCGGSGTFRNIINCFYKSGAELSDYEFAFYPRGLTNDFLKVFGKEQEHFSNVYELIEGDVVNIDYIKTNHGVALNTLSTGLDADYVAAYDNYKEMSVLSPVILSILSVLKSTLFPRFVEYEVLFGTNEIRSVKSNLYEIIFGNGCVLGGILKFSPPQSVTDGICSAVVIPKSNVIRKIITIFQLILGKYEKLAERNIMDSCSTFSIKRTNGGKFNLNFDGELEIGVTECIGEIVCKGLKFVIPKAINTEGLVER